MKIGFHYSFQVAPHEDTQAVIQQGLQDIAAADRDGFSSVLFAEHHFLDDGWLPRPMMLAAAAAAITKNMRVGTDIVILALHHPVAVAEEAAVTDVLSGGRFILGCGLGWLETEFKGFGVPFKQRSQIYDHSLGLVKRLLRGETVSGDGHHKFENARLRPLPVNPKGVPIWIGALVDLAVKRAARRGDAWVMPPGNRLSLLLHQQRLFNEEREAAGLPPVTEQPLRREAFVAETDAKAWDLFAYGLRHEYGNVYRSLHPTYPDNDTIDNLRKWGEDLFVVGSPETVAAQLKRYKAELKATECLIRFQLPSVPVGAQRDSLAGFRDVKRLLERP